MVSTSHDSSFIRLFSSFSCLSSRDVANADMNLSKAGNIVDAPSSIEVSAITRVAAPFGAFDFFSRFSSAK